MPTALPRRLSIVLLRLSPFVSIALMARPLHFTALPVALAAPHVALLAVALAVLATPWIAHRTPAVRLGVIAGLAFVFPFVLIASWVGLGLPFQATPIENERRYLVLMAAAIAAGCGALLTREALRASGESVSSAIGAALLVIAAPLHVVWACVEYNTNAMLILTAQGHALPDVSEAFGLFSDGPLFVASLLTYVASAALALGLARARLLGQGTARALAWLAGVLAVLLALRGVRFPDPSHGFATPWALVGFIAGIPAVPLILPFQLGVSLLSHAERLAGRSEGVRDEGVTSA